MPSTAACDFVLFGATGDLAMRKLLPALYRRSAAGHLTDNTRIIGVARMALSREEFVNAVETHCRKHLATEFDVQQWPALAKRLDYVALDAAKADDYSRLAMALKDRDTITRVFFLSTAPSLFTHICQHLAAHSLVTPASRVVLEKPLGHDLSSAIAINEQVGAIFAEHQIYRIDHYLGKEAVQNLIALRFGNTLFEPLWRRGQIRHVQITVAEQLGVEGRGAFYDQTGALRDMVQNHLLQLLCILAMEPPASSDADAVRDEKLKVLRALRPILGHDVAKKTVRGQYKSGAINGAPVIGFLNEPGITNGSVTETFVAIKAEIDTWRWAGVPFYLRTGKRLQERTADIVVTFEDVPHSIFDSAHAAPTPNKLVIRLQPDESITLTISAKQPGEDMKLKAVNLRLDLAESFKTESLKSRRFGAYERLLMDVAKGNLTLFMRRDELDSAWRWIDPIRAAWSESDEKPKQYIAGTWGPAASSLLLSRDGFSWHDES